MTLPAADTVVTYPDGDLASTGTVLHVEPLADGRSAVILDRTAFHPVDPVWPDQPADAGTLTVDGRAVTVVGAVVGATDGTTLHVGDLFHTDVVGARAAGLETVLLDPFGDWLDVDCERAPDLASVGRRLLAPA